MTDVIHIDGEWWRQILYELHKTQNELSLIDKIKLEVAQTKIEE